MVVAGQRLDVLEPHLKVLVKDARGFSESFIHVEIHSQRMQASQKSVFNCN